MTKFKLRNMAIAGVMAMGLAMTSGIQANAATDVKIGEEQLSVTVDLKNEKISITGKKGGVDSIFYTDVKNAKKTVPTSDKWVKAEVISKDGSYEKSEIDFSYVAKETVLYIATTPTPKAEDIIAITIPAQPVLTAKYANPVGTINSATPNSGKGNDKDVFDFTTKLGKEKPNISVNRIQIKKTAASDWTDFKGFFNDGVLESLQNKGTTLYARITPLENVTLDFVDVENGDKINETKRYSIVASQEDKTDTINNIVRGSASAKIAIKGRANASKVTYDYDKFTIKIGKGLSYQKLDDLTKVVSEGGFKANTVTDTKGKIIDIPQATKDTQAEQYYAVRKEGTDKAIASNINYVTVPAQPLIKDALKADDVTVEVVGKQGENAILTFKRSVATPEAITYQYAVAAPSEAENEDGTLKLDKLTWKKATIAKNKANVSINLKYDAASTKAGAFKDGTAIYVRKVSNKKTNTLASTYYKLTQPDEGSFAWKQSYQTDKTENSIIALGDLSYTVNPNKVEEITFSIPVYGNSSAVSAIKNIKIMDITKGKGNKATEVKDTDISAYKIVQEDSGLYNLQFKLTSDEADVRKLEITLDTGAIEDSKSGLVSAAKTYSVTVDNKNPEVAENTATSLKVGKNGKAGAKIAIKFTEAVTPGAVDLKETTTVTATSGGTLKLSSASFDKSYKTLTIEIEDKITPESGKLKVVLPDGITDTSLAKNKLVGDILNASKGFEIEVKK